MELHLFWIDKNWKQRGYAKNYNLLVNLTMKSYTIFINSFFAYEKAEDIEVKKKSDIIDYIKYLNENGFTEIKINI